MPDKYKLYDIEYDLENCSSEPLHRIHSIQPFSELIITDKSLTSWYYATEKFVKSLQKQSPKELVSLYLSLDQWDTKEELTFIEGDKHNVIIHSENNLLIFEIVYNSQKHSIYKEEALRDATVEIMSAPDLDNLLVKAVNCVYEIIGYDQVMIYKFDHDGSGKVMLEQKKDTMPSYMGLKFPASDIPEQARQLYNYSKIRSVYNTEIEHNRLYRNTESKTDYELDLKKVHARGVSPIHMQYLRNMGVNSSFSLGISVDNELWGLIACHNKSPRFLYYQEREWLKFLSILISNQINLQLTFEDKELTNKYKILNNTLFLDVKKSDNLVEKIINNASDIFKIFKADGISVFVNGIYETHGIVLDEAKVFKMASEFDKKEDKDQIVHDNRLPSEYVNGNNIAGYLYLPMSLDNNNFIIIYRAERKYKETWAGNPNKSKAYDPDNKSMNPRNSFSKWIDEVNGTSLPWTKLDIKRAQSLKENIYAAVYQRFGELEKLYNKLELAYAELENFSSVLSHDLKAPLRIIENFTKFVIDDFGDQIGNKGLEMLDATYENAQKMKTYINGILEYSKFAKSVINVNKLDLEKLITKEVSSIKHLYPKLEVELNCQLQEIYGDELMITQVICNLIDNAAKYSSTKNNPRLSIDTYEENDNFYIVFKDNGIGIPDKMLSAIFDMYRRAVSNKQHEGTGIGLSIVKSVILRHEGEVIATHNEPEGAVIKIKMPNLKSKIGNEYN